MIIGETHHNHHDHDGGPPWADPFSSSPPPSPTAIITALHHHLLSPELISNVNDTDHFDYYVPSIDVDDDEFFMYDFKVRMCTRVRAHDWTECPFAHPGEKARRRDPRSHIYSGSACSAFRKGGCHKGDSCEFAHGVFECWLHPSRYRTQPCKDGPGCCRRVCFFAHHPYQLRAGSGSGSDPVGSGPGSGSVGDLIASLRSLQLSKVKSMPTSWAGNGLHVGSPRGLGRPGFLSLPTTPNGPGVGYVEWSNEKGPLMERVESGRELRARMFEKLSKENPLDGPGPGPDLGWVSDLIK